MVTEILPNLYLVDLDQKIEGYRKFISSWIYFANGLTIVVDPGPSSTIPTLQKALNQLEIKTIDYILLTHVHIDHAGGTGLLLEKYPKAKINCHPKGIPHMIDPQQLWEGSRKVLGNVAEAFGPIAPIPANNISWQPMIKENDLLMNVFETPGHASHHVCYQIGDILFAGEVCGVNVPVEEGDYLRIATPPRFIYEIYRNSLISASKIDANHICFGHYGYRTDLSHVFNLGLNQLETWVRIVGYHFKKTSHSEEEIFEELIDKDPAIYLFNSLPEDIKKREKYYCLNSIKGMLGYFMKKSEAKNDILK